MSRSLRGLLVALVVLVLGSTLLAAVPVAQASRVPPHSDRRGPAFTHAKAQAVLARAKRQLHVGTRRLPARGRVVPSSSGTDLTLTLRDLHYARPSLTGPDRGSADTILARPSDRRNNVYDPVKWTAPTAYRHNDCQGSSAALALHVCVHYVSRGGDKDNATTSFVQQVSQTMEHVWNYETRTMGYKKPLNDVADGTIDNPDGRLDVYLADLHPAGVYGYCVADGSSIARHLPAYCVLDNNFLNYGISPINALRVTAAHEFFHAVQYAYDADEDPWFMEGTASWMEDEVYDSINNNIPFLAYSPIVYPWVPADLTGGFHRYGSWIFFKFASEYLRDRGIVRRFWQLADAGTSSRYSLQAIRTAVSARTSWSSFFASFAAWNTRQPHGYSEARRYPAPSWVRIATLGRRRATTRWVSTYLPHLSSAPVEVVPSARLSPRRRLQIQAYLPPTARGSALLVQRRYRNGAVRNSLMRLNAQGDGRVRIGFNRKYLAYVALIPVNTSTAMVACGYITAWDGGPAYSCRGRGYYDYRQKYAVRATVT